MHRTLANYPQRSQIDAFTLHCIILIVYKELVWVAGCFPVISPWCLFDLLSYYSCAIIMHGKMNKVECTCSLTAVSGVDASHPGVDERFIRTLLLLLWRARIIVRCDCSVTGIRPGSPGATGCSLVGLRQRRAATWRRWQRRRRRLLLHQSTRQRHLRHTAQDSARNDAINV